MQNKIFSVDFISLATLQNYVTQARIAPNQHQWANGTPSSRLSVFEPVDHYDYYRTFHRGAAIDFIYLIFIFIQKPSFRMTMTIL